MAVRIAIIFTIKTGISIIYKSMKGRTGNQVIQRRDDNSEATTKNK